MNTPYEYLKSFVSQANQGIPYFGISEAISNLDFQISMDTRLSSHSNPLGGLHCTIENINAGAPFMSIIYAKHCDTLMLKTDVFSISQLLL